VKSSWTCWLIALSLLAAVPAGAAKRDSQRSADELINVFLSPGRAQWLIGPIARLASEEEVEAYLALTDDAAADGFMGEFWARRKPIEGLPGLDARRQFERLAQEADRQFGEETYPGRRTDRGTIFIIYGPPDEVDYQPSKRARYGEVEIWLYRGAKVGLDGQAPKRTYFFIQEGDLTRFAKGNELPRVLPRCSVLPFYAARSSPSATSRSLTAAARRRPDRAAPAAAPPSRARIAAGSTAEPGLPRTSTNRPPGGPGRYGAHCPSGALPPTTDRAN
jgi:GWxTD domain-containing protein